MGECVREGRREYLGGRERGDRKQLGIRDNGGIIATVIHDKLSWEY